MRLLINARPISPVLNDVPDISMFSIWWLAIRPKTLSISLTPVLLGSALAWHEQQQLSLSIFIVTLISALTIQIGTNLYNDAVDYEKGADTHQRLGPRRAAQQGWLTAQEIKTGALLSFIFAFISGTYLAWTGGWPIIILGLLSILCGYAYTAGPKPIAYSPFGELFVLIFFGFAAVSGSYYLQTLNINLITLLVSSTIGSMAAAILLVNNYRDLEGDEKAHKLTLVHYTGRPAARILYSLMLLYPYLCILFLIKDFSWLILLPMLSLPMAIKLIIDFSAMDISSALNQILTRTAQLQLVYTVLFVLAMLFNMNS